MRAIRASRGSRPTSASTRARRSTSRSTRRRPTTASTSTGSATTAASAPGSSTPSTPPPRPRPSSRTAWSSTARTDDNLVDCGNWSVSASWSVPAGTPPPASTSPSRPEPTTMGRATSRSSCATTTAGPISCSRPSDTTWQAYNQYGGYSLYARSRARPQGQLQPTLHHPRRAGRGLAVQRRVPDAPLARAQRLRRQLLQRRRHRPRRRRAARARGLPVGGPRRVLVGRAARQRRGCSRRRGRPRVLQRQRGLLEDALGAEHGRRRQHRPPDARVLQGGRRPGQRALGLLRQLRLRSRSGHLDRAVAAERRRPRRRPARERAQRPDQLARLDRHARGAGGPRRPPVLAQHRDRRPDEGSATLAARHARLRVGLGAAGLRRQQPRRPDPLSGPRPTARPTR